MKGKFVNCRHGTHGKAVPKGLLHPDIHPTGPSAKDLP
jgi:hypothetical protein